MIPYEATQLGRKDVNPNYGKEKGMVRMTHIGEQNRRPGVPKPMVAGALVACLVLAVGCAPLRQRREAVEPAGFLGD